MKTLSNSRLGGFTLIELLVVVLIIGILSAIALPQYQKAVLKSKVAAVLPKVTALETAQKEFKMANGYYTGDLAALSIDTGVWSCNRTEDSSIDFCQIRVASGLGWEMHFGTGRSASYRIYCIANKSYSLADSICKEYGTLKPESSTGSYNYYVVREVY